LTLLGVTGISTVHGDYSYESGRDLFLDVLERDAPPDAVVCANDQMAMGVMDACRFSLGWRVPEDISVVGFDNIDEAGRPTYDLTTVAQQLEPMAERAVEMLLRRFAKPEAEAERVILAGPLIRRASARLG
jgi:DNA-binding LacI/PurR family transcriptional regulator